MKKLIILFLLIAAAITTRGQNQSSGDPIILNTEQTEGGLKSSCGGYVLQDGFSYKAEGDERLVLRADPELCSDEDEDDFAYNRNGCMTKDLTKGIRKIEYNALNLPQKIYIKNSKIEAIFEYNYLANGVKVRTVKRWNPGIPTAGKEVNEASLTDSLQTDYLGNKIYENGELKTILVDGGYYDCEKEKYFFYLTDHLGNNRVVADEDGNIVETNHYYPFGETFAENTKQDVQPYKYNGKELNKDLNLYDYSARHYAPSIGRFTTMDPLAEKYYNISPYAYVANNPLKFIDPTGEDIWIYYNDAKGNQQRFSFNGSNHNMAPKNEFVSQFLEAYDYNIKNGGGDNLKEAATNKDLTVRVIKSSNGKSRRQHLEEGKRMPSFVIWAPTTGVETTDGKTLSPATMLEHETAHEVSLRKDSQTHNKRRREDSKKYETKEEERVITGPEARTAQANGEVPAGYVRPNHKGERIVTSSPTSNKKIKYLEEKE